VQAQPMSGEAWGRLGRSYRREGGAEPALHALRRAAELKTSDARDWLDLSLLLEDTGECESAIDAARSAARFAPDSPRILVNLGTQLLNNARPHEAIELGRLAHALDPFERRRAGAVKVAIKP